MRNSMRSYFRVMLGKNSAHALECFAGGFIGANFGINQDLTDKLPDEWRHFNREFIPVYLELNPAKTKVAAGLACGALWTVSKGIHTGDFVLCPNGAGQYMVGEVTGNYYYVPGGILPHRRPVKWLDGSIDRSEMSSALRASTGSAGTVSDISRYTDEIELLLNGSSSPVLVSTDESVEDPVAFAMEKHLEDFLIQNWNQTPFAKDYDIYQDDGERGQQVRTDTGFIDILAISKDKRTLLVIELKKGRASDAVVGQILRYMGYVKEELLEQGQTVKGVIIALEDDQRIRRALSMVSDVEFYRYQVTFKLSKV
jgi:restriction system protein